MTSLFYVSTIVKAIVVLFVAFVRCQETLEDDASVKNAADHKEKRGISLNLGQGLEGYSYLGPSSSYSRGYPSNRGYTPITEFGKAFKLILMSRYVKQPHCLHIALIKTKCSRTGYDGVNYGAGSSNFASGYQGGYQGYNQPSGSYPYRGYPTSYSYQRQYNTPVNTYPLGGIGTVGPYGGGN